jgi:hypothetical protein
MAEVKNAFIKSKMNKDLDSRLLPSGEYRDGQNVQVSKSEGEDVGALENAPGNSIAKLNTNVDVDFSVLSGLATGTLKSIGVYANEGTSSVFVFLTDQSLPRVSGTGETAATINYSSDAKNFIYSYNGVTKSVVKLAEGAFLNFSQQYPIYGINLLENLLFWTDNRNQPRKINIERGYESYINEDTISVAKYNPYETIDLYYVDGGTPYSSMQDVVTPYLPNGGQALVNEPAGVTGNIIAINNIIGNVPLAEVSVTGDGIASGTKVVSWTPNVIPNLGGNVTLNNTVTLTDNTVLVFSQNPFYNKPLGVPIEAGGSWPGDPIYLEDKFVSFSYRFTFEDGEKSIMAPFTQEAFIPKKDGYFLVGDEDKVIVSGVVEFMENKVNNVGLYIPLGKNSTGDVDLSPSTIRQEVGVTEIEILFKESDSLAVKVLDTIGYQDFQTKDGNPDTSNQYIYSYQSRKPYKTLPESEIIRVYDKTPVRAFGQEIISNRVVYSNFQDKHTPPALFDYDVVVNQKSPYSESGLVASQTTSSVEYPQHNVKQNRSYQLGFILSDRYGRQSSTILSKVKPSSKTQDGITFGGSTFYHPYTSNPGANNNINTWSGDSLKVSVNTPPVPTNSARLPDALTGDSSGWNGIYNGDSSSSDYNPLGWYSYKIVVKQTELEYYNVYVPGILNGYPDHGNTPISDLPSPEDSVAFITLLGDNVNKVPRDLNEISGNQAQFRSNVKLYGRVTPPSVILATGSTDINVPYYPITNPQTVSTIATQDELFKDDVGNQQIVGPPYSTVYEEDSNPYLARLAQGNNPGNPIGSLQAADYKDPYRILLGVFETNPRVSLLDIYYETSTTGLVEDLNAVAGQDSSTDGFEDWVYDSQTEGMVNGDVVQTFNPIYNSGITTVPVYNSTVVLLSVVRISTGEDASSLWTLNKIDKNDPNDGNGVFDQYTLTVNESIYHRPLEDNRFKFTFKTSGQFNSVPAQDASQGDAVNDLFMRIENVAPTINVDVPSNPLPTLTADRLETQPIATFTAVNGYVPTGSNTEFTDQDDLSWTISNQIPAPSSVIPELTINSNGEVRAPLTAKGTYTFSVEVIDSGGDVNSRNMTAVFGQEEASAKFGSMPTPQRVGDGLTSTGFYWGADYSSSTLIGGDDVPVEVKNTDGGRAPYGEDLQLSDTGLESSSSQTVDFASAFVDVPRPGESSTNQYYWHNENRKPLSFQPNSTVPDFDSNNTLDKGTAYIRVDYSFKMFPNYNTANIPQNQLGVGWPTYLQYRPVGSTNWVTAVDVEGQDVHYGGWQKNYNESNGASVPSSSIFYDIGFLNNASIGHKATVGDISDIATSYNDFMPQNTLQTTSVLSKIFVFGKDQGYEETPDKFGEYRLIIRYPQSAANDANGYSVVPTPGNTSWNSNSTNPFRIDGSGNTNRNLQIKLAYGDFYYPQGTTGSRTSYPYLISPTPSVNAFDASFKTPSVTVWAREWAMGYVTQFYTDSTLVTPITNFAAGYYCYSPSSSEEAEFVYENGTENSWVNGQDEFAPNYSLVGTTNNLKALRRFVADFDSNAKKIKGTSVPVTASFTQF